MELFSGVCHSSLCLDCMDLTGRISACLPFPDLLLHLCNWKQFSALFHCVPVTFPFVSVCFCDCFCSCACVFCYQSQNSTRMVASPFEAGDALGYLLNNINSFATDNLVKVDIKQLAWILEQIFSPNGSNAHHWVYPVCCSANALAAFMFFQNDPPPSQCSRHIVKM